MIILKNESTAVYLSVFKFWDHWSIFFLSKLKRLKSDYIIFILDLKKVTPRKFVLSNKKIIIEISIKKMRTNIHKHYIIVRLKNLLFLN